MKSLYLQKKKKDRTEEEKPKDSTEELAVLAKSLKGKNKGEKGLQKQLRNVNHSWDIQLILQSHKCQHLKATNV